MFGAVQAIDQPTPSSSLSPRRERSLTPSRRRAVTRRFLALIALAISLVFALPASAGTLHVSDDAGVFNANPGLTLVRSTNQVTFINGMTLTAGSAGMPITGRFELMCWLRFRTELETVRMYRYRPYSISV